MIYFSSIPDFALKTLLDFFGTLKKFAAAASGAKDRSYFILRTSRQKFFKIIALASWTCNFFRDLCGFVYTFFMSAQSLGKGLN